MSVNTKPNATFLAAKKAVHDAQSKAGTQAFLAQVKAVYGSASKANQAKFRKAMSEAGKARRAAMTPEELAEESRVGTAAGAMSQVIQAARLAGKDIEELTPEDFAALKLEQKRAGREQWILKVAEIRGITPDEVTEEIEKEVRDQMSVAGKEAYAAKSDEEKLKDVARGKEAGINGYAMQIFEAQEGEEKLTLEEIKAELAK